jgi:hypothetical protein
MLTHADTEGCAFTTVYQAGRLVCDELASPSLHSRVADIAHAASIVPAPARRVAKADLGTQVPSASAFALLYEPLRQDLYFCTSKAGQFSASRTQTWAQRKTEQARRQLYYSIYLH